MNIYVLQITVSSILDVVASCPEDGSFLGNTDGLLGNNDGDDTNDYAIQGGQILAKDSTEEQLYEFGSSCELLIAFR